MTRTKLAVVMALVVVLAIDVIEKGEPLAEPAK